MLTFACNRIILLSILVLVAIRGSAQLKVLMPDVNLKSLYGEISPVCDCSALTKVSIPNTRIESAVVNEKEGSCRVTAIVNHPPANDSVKVWIGLPLKNWNGRFEGTGGGGFLGGTQLSLGNPMKQGFAVGATNTGHDGGSGSFALDSNRQLQWQLIRDNAYLGIHDMTVVGKALIQAFYGKPARYAYFFGGSTGGRQGLSEAQRYPDDYDGILSLCPATNWTHLLAADLWPQVVMHEVNDYLPAQKLVAFNKALLEAVDAKDGHIDSVIEDPLHLQFDPKVFVGMKMGNSNFTEADAEVIRKIWGGAKTVDGKFLWYGTTPGTDLRDLAGTKGDPPTGNPFGISVDWVRYFLVSDPSWKGVPLTHKEFQLLCDQSMEQYNEVFATDNPDLTRFRDHGGKLVIVHGLSDNLIAPQGSINYYERVRARMGGAAETSKFARVFLLPGLDHGFNGYGAKPTDHLDLLIHWVEEGKVPEHINAEVRDKSNNLVRSRSFAAF
jgi:feruloyl esterase